MERFKNSLIAALLMLLAVGCGNIFSPLLNTEPAPPVPKPAGLVDDWEDQDANSHMGTGESADVDTYGSGLTIQTTVAGSDLPGGTPNGAARFFGNLNANMAPNWPWAMFTIPWPGSFDLDALAPTKRLHFSYKAAGGSVGIGHIVRFWHLPATDYCWYEYTFTPPDTAWHEIDLVMPDGTGTPMLAQCPWGAPVPWSTVKVTTNKLLFLSNGSSSAATTFDLTVDDVYFH